ncbi:TonB-dependent siderophore receptor [Ramlibacter tataouinensis]|uniref:Outer membrane protein, TonB-dependent receptor-like protein n=1 Tax=Ramlibacter tataouinensis (strain ATCC BAA-407 / DSM 14655 / LMG 21543 / TTB310) TaxID=365046 RepID=F5Y1T9_RAMTT|nr:TonB-dependent receptor [Ramlibacter tataouinensis]AEG93523.1 outer membrane protein precursor, TonB-dependent receptor-like protein [Ramlibacter tataouinensis TTB310]
MKKKSHPALARTRTGQAALLLIASCGTALAQTTAAPERSLGEVRVTGDSQRSFSSRNVQVGAFRDQDPLDVPLTNNVVTREVLDAQQAGSVYEALRNTAGVTRSQLSGSTYDNISIRGILVENRGNYRLNGSLPVINLIDIPLENKERVEVLKGASSLYYGLVPPSGIVNFVTKRAGTAPVTSIASSVNQHGGFDLHADVGRRFADGSMGLRVNALAGQVDYGIANFDGDRRLFSVAYDWRVTPGFTLRADLEHYRKDVSEQAAIANPAAVGGVITLPPVPDNRRNLAGAWQRYDARATNALLRGDLALGDHWVLTLEIGRAETERDRRFSQLNGLNVATGVGTLAIFFGENQRYVNTNHRAETTGRFGTGPVQHELTVGYTYNRREAYSGESAPTANVPQNLYDPIVPAPINPAAFTPGTDSAIEDKGLYVFDRLTLGERWQLLAGLRAADYSNTGPTSRYSASKTSPNLSVLYKLRPDTTLYASYLEGLEETGTAPANRANAGEILAPSVNKQREIGLKTRALANLLTQVSLFQIDRPQTSIDAGNRFILGGESRYRGLEASASGEIGHNFSAIASALLLDAEIVRVGTANAGELGRTPENTPRRTFSLFGEWRLPQVAGLFLNAGAYYVGERPVNNLNQAYVGSYTTLSLGARYVTQVSGRNLTLQANLDNAADRDYWATAGNGLLGTGAPRTLRVAAKIDL